jgi:hypothetical protein
LQGYTDWVGGSDVSAPICVPIRRGDYYRVQGLNAQNVEDNTGIAQLNFLSM